MRIFTLLVPALLGSAVLAQENRLTSARLDGDVLRLSVNDELQAVRHFPLPGPPRVVVDLFGIDASVAEMPAPAAGSPAFEVRTGQHPGFVRVVVDLKSALPSYQVRQSEGLVEIGLGTTLPPSATGVLVGESPVPGAAPAPRPAAAPVVDVAVEAAPAARPAPSASPASPAPTGSALQNLDDLTTDELLELIDAELAAAGLDQQESAEELIEQVEAELAARPPSPAVPEAPAEPERRAPAEVGDPADRPPFRFIDEEPDAPPK